MKSVLDILQPSDAASLSAMRSPSGQVSCILSMLHGNMEKREIRKVLMDIAEASDVAKFRRALTARIPPMILFDLPDTIDLNALERRMMDAFETHVEADEGDVQTINAIHKAELDILQDLLGRLPPDSAEVSKSTFMVLSAIIKKLKSESSPLVPNSRPFNMAARAVQAATTIALNYNKKHRKPCAYLLVAALSGLKEARETSPSLVLYSFSAQVASSILNYGQTTKTPTT